MKYEKSKAQRVITTVLICLTVAVGLIFAVLGADEALEFLGDMIEFIWVRFKGFVVGALIVVPLWLLWWIISSIIDRVRINRMRAEAEARRPVCPRCRSQIMDNGRFCKFCGWDFTRPAAEALNTQNYVYPGSAQAEMAMSTAGAAQGGACAGQADAFGGLTAAATAEQEPARPGMPQDAAGQQGPEDGIGGELN